MFPRTCPETDATAVPGMSGRSQASAASVAPVLEEELGSPWPSSEYLGEGNLGHSGSVPFFFYKTNMEMDLLFCNNNIFLFFSVKNTGRPKKEKIKVPRDGRRTQ